MAMLPVQIVTSADLSREGSASPATTVNSNLPERRHQRRSFTSHFSRTSRTAVSGLARARHAAGDTVNWDLFSILPLSESP
jgi:hypothetical protein